MAPRGPEKALPRQADTNLVTPLAQFEYSVELPAKPPRTLGTFDATMIAMGGIIGSGIFINPYVVAQQVHTPFLIVGVWVLGGLVAMAGAFIWAELACRLPGEGGQYFYLKEAYHPAIAFLYGWTLLLVIQTGATAAVAVTFARYLRELTGLTTSDGWIAAGTLLLLTAINCLGARTGSNLQNTLMILKSVAIIALIVGGLQAPPAPTEYNSTEHSRSLAIAIGAAMIPVAFAYGGWQNSTFLAAEMRNARRDLSRGIIFGVIGVIVLYVSVNFVCVRALGPVALEQTHTPASAVMRASWGEVGARWIALGIVVSTLGWTSQAILTSPRVYYAMARDGLFFQAVSWVSPRTGAPIVAILLQGTLATIIVLIGKYEQILNFVISMDFSFFVLCGGAIFVLRARTIEIPPYRVPGHPYTTAFFMLACAAIVASTFISFPSNSLVGLAITLAGLPVYLLWRRTRAQTG